MGDETINSDTQAKRKPWKQVLRNGLGHSLPRYLQIILNIIALAAVPYLAFFLVETLFQITFMIKPQIQVLNYILYAAVYLTLFGITGSLKWATRIYAVLMWAVGTLNYAVIAFRSTPIVPWDIYSLNTAVSVADNYKFPFTAKYLIVTGLFLALFVLASLLTARLKGRLTHLSVLTASIILLTGSLLYAMRAETKDGFGLDDTLFNTNYMSRHNGFVLNFVHSVRYLNVEMPAGYSVARVEALNEAYSEQLKQRESESRRIQLSRQTAGRLSPGQSVSGSESQPALNPVTALPVVTAADPYHQAEISRYLQAVNTEAGRTLAPGEEPDIVIVMNEAFSDMRAVQDYETNLPVMPFFEGLTVNTQKGIAHPSVVGGNTATSEFEFLTGASMAFLPSGSIAYQQYIKGPTPTLVSLLEEQGYGSAALHPYHAKGWMRNSVYPYFGFDRIKFLPDFANRGQLRRYISDEALYREIMMELDRPMNNGQPQFVFTISMQNHGGYTKDSPNFKPKVEITDLKSSKALNVYLSLVRESDRALGRFLAELKEREKPTLVLFFGDHQPNDYTAGPLTRGLDAEDVTVRRREVPFLLWANYDLPEAEGLRTSLNYLSNYVLAGADLELSPWHAFLRDVEAEIPAINDAFYYTADGERHILDEDVALPDILSDYEIAQYNYLFDVSNRVEPLFEAVD